MLIEKLSPKPWDTRRDLIVPGNQTATLTYCVEHFIHTANQAIRDHNAFFVALSGGSTPKALFEAVSSPNYRSLLDWTKCHLFWSDERVVPLDHPDSNYNMAMQAGLKKVPIPPAQIHPMVTSDPIEESATAYEKRIQETLKGKPFDLVMLGLGEDGHTASLFPNTEGLQVKDRLVIANFIEAKKCWRMTFTYKCINAAQNITIYVLGSGKQHILSDVLFSSSNTYPIEKIGTPTHKALFIADEAAAEGIALRKSKM